MAETMSAIAIRDGKGEADALHVMSVARPIPADGELLIRVSAAGVNRPDILQRQGRYPPPAGASEVLGLEVAGEVVIGAGRWQRGDKVCALLAGGGYAEYVTVDARHALPLPTELSELEAAALPETIFTVYANVFEHGGLKAGETLLIHGATSGIGVAAIQMAKAAGAQVIATARSAAKAEAARQLGADVVVDTSSEDFAAVAKAAGGVDVVLDMVGASYFEGTLDALNLGGRIAYIAALGGNRLTVPVMAVMLKQAVITGSTLRGRSADEKARLAESVEQLVWPWIEAGKVRAVVDKTFSLDQAAEAHAWLESGQHTGKVMLVVP